MSVYFSVEPIRDRQSQARIEDQAIKGVNMSVHFGRVDPRSPARAFHENQQNSAGLHTDQVGSAKIGCCCWGLARPYFSCNLVR